MNSKEYLSDRQRAYQLALSNAPELLDDLSNFCRANSPTFHADPRVHALLEGRREVWLRIQDHLKLNLDELFVKYGGTLDERDQ